MKIGVLKKEKRLDLAIKHIQLIIDGKEYYIRFHYSLRNGIKDVCVYGIKKTCAYEKTVRVIDAYPPFPKVVKTCVWFILVNFRTIMYRSIHKLKDRNQLNEHK